MEFSVGKVIKVARKHNKVLSSIAIHVGQPLTPKPVSAEFIRALKEVGARPGLIKSIERFNRELELRTIPNFVAAESRFRIFLSVMIALVCLTGTITCAYVGGLLWIVAAFLMFWTIVWTVILKKEIEES